MKSLTSPDFWRTYASLSPNARAAARKAYRLWKENPQHGSLRFKNAAAFGGLVLAAVIAPWPWPYRRDISGSGLAHTTNTNACFAAFKRPDVRHEMDAFKQMLDAEFPPNAAIMAKAVAVRTQG
jgi:hypothetical protein